MSYRCTLIPGDGIGPEITAATCRILEATGVSFEWETVQAGITAMDAGAKEPLPDSVLDSIRKNKLALKGPIGTPIGTGFRSVNVALRQGLDLYACVRPCKTYPGIVSRYSDINLVIIRENTEDLYAGIEFDKGSAGVAALEKLVAEQMPGKKLPVDSAVSLKPISEGGSRRIVEFAFQYAIDNNRRKVTAIHKANIMKFSDGLFLRVAREVAEKYPQIQFEEMIVDAACMNLVIRPESFDVMVLGNLYGDIVSDLCAGLVGGLGVAPGGNIGTHATVFEATHGTAPMIAGKGIANPMAMLLSGRLMLKHIGERDAARRLEDAIKLVLREGVGLTPDLNPSGQGSTEGFADAVIHALNTKVPA